MKGECNILDSAVVCAFAPNAWASKLATGVVITFGVPLVELSEDEMGSTGTTFM